jgi:hypothetical protein
MAIKVGDRVVTSGGNHCSNTRVEKRRSAADMRLGDRNLARGGGVELQTLHTKGGYNMGGGGGGGTPLEGGGVN